MELQVLNKQMRRQEWVEMVTSCRNSGLTVETWCQANGISVGTYYYRQKQVVVWLLNPKRSSFNWMAIRRMYMSSGNQSLPFRWVTSTFQSNPVSMQKH